MGKWLFTALVIVMFNVTVHPQSIEDCLVCHEDADLTTEQAGKELSLYIDDNIYQKSVHGEMACVDCHTAIEELPHNETLPRVDCGDCHSDETETYEWHGRLAVSDGGDIPACSDCHGKHDIFPSHQRESQVNPINLPQTCGRCHEDINLTNKHELLYGKAIQMYKSSVHGKAYAGGVYLAATCKDCHFTGGTAHRILGPGSPESSINHFNIPTTCGQCHRNITSDFWEGIHGQLVARGETGSPVCTNCHGEHGIVSPSDPRSPVSPTRVAQATCEPCHESAYLNERYGILSRRVQTWVDSYHGLKSKEGDVTVANCASCHGAHRILPHTDSTSSIHPLNLQKTCGECHPGISEALAATPIHATPGISRTPVARLISNVYIVAIILIIGTMVLHWLVDLRKQIRLVILKKQIRRMTFNEVWQHTFLMVSFIVLGLSGFSLRFSDAFWVQWLFGWEGGFLLRGTIHRVAAVIFILTAIWHVLYLATDRGRGFLRDIFPVKRDLRQFLEMLRYNIGLKKEKPRFPRFSYVEKAEYWALAWGSVLMIITGLFLWFDNIAVRWFPKEFLDVMLVIHYYEAWLAVLAIFVWHLYSTIFSPHVYPMNPSWLTGKMPLEWYQHEHPDDPILQDVAATDSSNGGDDVKS